ncbi:oligosaccharide flippase family protein (plasmid) [Deinococcus radiomollis]|uniref:lipopolysaccharide biosynthesis protein n=1 Tax=Deinococcus radiomollis TaxID=468916 RepID=UPI0038925ED1
MVASENGAPEVPRSAALRLNMLWTLAGNLVFAATQWGVLVVLARLGSPADLGRYTLGLAITTPMFLLLSLQLRGAQATEPAGSAYRFGHYFTLRTVLSLGALLLCAVYALISSTALAPVVLWLGLAKLFDSVSDVCYGHLQARHGLREVSQSLILRGLLSVLLLGAAYALTRQVSWAAAGTALGYLLGLALFDVPHTRRGTGPWWLPERATLLRLARLTWPLGVAVGLIALNASLPRYFLGRERGLNAVGLFTAMSYVTVAGSMVVTALGQAATTPLARLAEATDLGPFRALLGRLLLAGSGLGVLGVLGAAALGRPLLGGLYGAGYAQDVPVFTLLMGAAGVSYAASFAGFGMTSLRQFRAQIPLFTATSGVLLLGCFLLIPASGLMGAAWATLFSAVTQLLGSLWVVWLELQRRQAGRAPVRGAG